MAFSGLAAVKDSTVKVSTVPKRLMYSPFSSKIGFCLSSANKIAGAFLPGAALTSALMLRIALMVSITAVIAVSASSLTKALSAFGQGAIMMLEPS